MRPEPLTPNSHQQWTQCLKRKFIHEEIFKNPSENRDFILSLNCNFTYHMSQLWINFEKVKASEITSKEFLNDETKTENKNRTTLKIEETWLYHLGKICYFLDYKTFNNFNINQKSKSQKILQIFEEEESYYLDKSTRQHYKNTISKFNLEFYGIYREWEKLIRKSQDSLNTTGLPQN